MKKTPFRHLLVVCDLEGSSACFTKRAAKFLNREWADACAGLTEDVGAVVTALFDAGAESVTVKDFHRTGHNLFTRRIDRRAKIISGYRSAHTNETLRTTRGGGVARRSLHMDGKAIDVRLPGIPLAGLRDAALTLQAGGVGYYPKEQFVHLDTGRVRSW